MNGIGGVYNFVTKRGLCRDKMQKSLGRKLKQVLLLHGNILLVFLKGDNSV